MNNTQNIQAWEALILTVKTGNISQTALLMGLDISKVSRLIAGLEEELGYPLLIKTKRPFKPTKKCEAIVEVADPLIKGFKQLEEYSKGVAKRSIFRIASPIEIAQEFYSEKLIAYSRTHPQINFEIVPETEVEKLLTDEVDIIVANKRPTDESNLVIRPYMETSTPVLCSPEYLRRYGVPKMPADLSKHTGLLLKTATHSPTRFLYFRGMESELLKWKTLFMTHDQLTIKRLLLNHQGVSPDLYFAHVLEELRNGDLIPILPGWERKPWQMSLITRQDKDIENAELRNFVLWWARSEAASSQERVIKGRQIIEDAYKRSKDIISGLE